MAKGMDLDSGKLWEQVARMRHQVAHRAHLKAAPWLSAELYSAYSQFADELYPYRAPGDRSAGPSTRQPN